MRVCVHVWSGGLQGSPGNRRWFGLNKQPNKKTHSPTTFTHTQFQQLALIGYKLRWGQRLRWKTKKQYMHEPLEPKNPPLPLANASFSSWIGAVMGTSVPVPVKVIVADDRGQKVGRVLRRTRADWGLLEPHLANKSVLVPISRCQASPATRQRDKQNNICPNFVPDKPR